VQVVEVLIVDVLINDAGQAALMDRWPLAPDRADLLSSFIGIDAKRLIGAGSWQPMLLTDTAVLGPAAAAEHW
jgi:hypothetical protein